MPSKVCSRCGIEKPLNAFDRSQDSKDGYKPRCKTCKRAMYEEERDAKLAAARVATKDKSVTKECSLCHEVKPLSSFGFDARNADGFRTHCRTCGGILAREYRQRPAYQASQERYGQSEGGRARDRRRSRRRRETQPEKVAANEVVKRAVAAGILPPARTQVCANCGAPALDWHHPDYSPEHHLDVVPLCRKCHANTYTTPYP